MKQIQIQSQRRFQNISIYRQLQNIIEEMNIDYAGVDLLFGENDEPILCEINSNSFFQEFEKVTKINVAKLFVEMVLEKLKTNNK